MGLSSAREAMPESSRGIFQKAGDAVDDAQVRRLFCNKFFWEFPKIRGTLFWGPCNEDPTI